MDSARLYSAQGYALDLRNHDLTSEVGDAATLGNLYAALGNPQQAQYYYRRSIGRASEARITFALCRAYLGQGRLFLRAAPAPTDSALYFGQQALAAGQRGSYPKGILEASQFLAVASAIRLDSAAVIRYLTLASTTRGSLFSKAKTTQMQALDVSERLRLQELCDQQAQAAAERRQLWLLAALVSAFPVLLLLWRNNYLRQRINQRLNSQNTQIATQRDELGEALTQLKATQDQLVQSEKITFLGELTAGIAHELQNPLAFVKNFAEVSSVLIDDMTDTAPRSPNPDSSQEVLLAGLRQNLREISQHGQRATSIIADMLARSRNGSSPRSQVDLNALLTEYLRPAYQGLRAKNKSFTATCTTHPAGSPPCARPSCDVRPGPRIHQPVYQCFLRGAAAPAGPRARLRTRINYNHPPNARRSR